jgi:hypothetical protein
MSPRLGLKTSFLPSGGLRRQLISIEPPALWPSRHWNACFGSCGVEVFVMVFVRLVSLTCCSILMLGGVGAGSAEGAPRALSTERIRLGKPGAPEWDEFANDPPRSEAFHLRFAAEPNATEATLFLRQTDVKQEWRVELNHARLGKLFLMEADLVQTFAIPPRGLRAGENVLSILPPLAPDDIILGDIVLDPRPPREATAETIIEITVTQSRSGNPLPCRITIVDDRGSLAPVVAVDETPPLAIRPGVVYAGAGRARVGLRPGRHTIVASKGFE